MTPFFREGSESTTKRSRLNYNLAEPAEKDNVIQEKVDAGTLSLVEGLTYDFRRTLGEYSRWADDGEMNIQDVDEMLEAHQEVLKETGDRWGHFPSMF